MRYARERILNVVMLAMVGSAIAAMPLHAAPLKLIEGGKPLAQVHVVPADRTADQNEAIAEAAAWLTEALAGATGVTLPVSEAMPEGAAVVLATVREVQPKGADGALLRSHHDAYAIVTEGNRLWLVGNNVYAVRHAVADLLDGLGFRYYAPSPTWHIIPKLDAVAIDVTRTEKPDLSTRSIWYAYGNPIAEHMQHYRQWATGNRLSMHRTTSTGHSYGHIINRNKEAFAAHPEYFALKDDGTRYSVASPNAAKFCVSNPGLIELVAADRIRLLEENRKSDPDAYMVSVDPSDGQGTCSCENCVALGTTSDRVFHLANEVAKRLRAKHPDAWVGLYAYSSHRLPPTIELEPNIYVQVAMGFNRTQYSLPELVELWSQKVGAIGLREYYGVEAWDWGLPGRMRGGRVDYHRKWIPYYAKRKLNAINAETNANWGSQALGLYIASALMWEVDADVDGLMQRYFEECYGAAAAPMKALQAKFDLASPLQPATLTPMFEDLHKAWELAETDAVRARLADMMAFMVYVEKYRQFDLVAAAEPSRNDAYYAALEPLMNYSWRIRERDIQHYYALARRLCNGLPRTDNRLDFYMYNKEQTPVWQQSESLTDDEVRSMFEATAKQLREDASPHVAFSRYFEPVSPPGQDAGPSRLHSGEGEGVISFRGTVTGYLVPGKASQFTVGLKPTRKRATLTVYARGEEVLLEQAVTDPDQFTQIVIELPRANEYRWVLQGDAILQAGPEVPLVYEASVYKPAWVEYSGPSYFYVPKGASQILVSGEPRVTLWVPGVSKRLDLTPAERLPGKDYCVINVPEGAAGTVWHTDALTRGKVILLNIPPLMSLHRETVFVPREVAEGDGLTTAQRVD